MNNLFEELRTALFTIWHRRWLALGVAWAICLLGWLVVAMIPNKYESKTRIFVQLDDPLAAKIGISGDDQKRAVEKVRQTLVSSINLEKVVRGTPSATTSRHQRTWKARSAAWPRRSRC
jgi:uncharacterized protein involved in exopolysaccharide biosynthesis